VSDPVLEQIARALRERYLVYRPIGSGATATVYLAEDLKHERPVAIKVLRPIFRGASVATRFLREIRYLAHLQHPHIIPLFDSGEADGLPFFVTAYVEGESLRQRLRRAAGGGVSLEETVHTVGAMADALDYAHQRNVLHRDVKPENVLLSGGHAYLADFGIARAIQLAGEKPITDSGVAIGTPAYMSPEQLLAERRLDGRSDVYSLAMVCYEMLAGVPPFYSAVLDCVDNARKFGDRPRALADHGVTGVPEAVERAVRRALAHDPAERFARPRDFATALGRVPAA
jgi:serine/threonine-protein kinase